jgi:transposase
VRSRVATLPWRHPEQSQHLDVSIRPEDGFFRVSSDDQGITDLVQRLGDLNPQLIVLEAIGGYEILAAGQHSDKLACRHRS